MKTVQDYMNDSRILNDPEMAGALEPIKRIHAIRLMSQDERAGMTAEEEIEYLNKQAKAFLARLGLTPQLVNLSGQGKLIPRDISIGLPPIPEEAVF
jgi:hypothetical protein